VSAGTLQFRTTRPTRIITKISSATRLIARPWFTVGVVVGVCGMVLAPLMLGANLLQSMVILWHDAVAGGHVHQTTAHSDGQQRAPGVWPTTAHTTAGPTDVPRILTPIVPGVTVPMSHLGYLFLTVRAWRTLAAFAVFVLHAHQSACTPSLYRQCICPSHTVCVLCRANNVHIE